MTKLNIFLQDTKIIYRVAQKSKPLPNDQKIVLHRIKTCE